MAANPFDQASRYLAKLTPLGFFRWALRRLPPSVGFRGWLDTRTIPFPGHPDRTCDTVACLVADTAPDELWAAVLEFQFEPDEEMFGRLLEYIGRLWRELRPGGPSSRRYAVIAVVINLTKRGKASLDLRFGTTGARTCLRVAERNLCDESATTTLRGIESGKIDHCILPLIPLMRDGAAAGIIAKWKQLAESEPSSKLRSDYGALALIFAELGKCRQEWKIALEGWNMVQSQQVLEWQEEARKEGEARGRAESILRMLELRVGTPVPANLAAQVRAVTDPAILDHWFDVAYSVTSFKEFRRRIKD